MRQLVAGICWPHEGTVGHLTPTSALVCGSFGAQEGNNGRIDCELVQAGKYRNGAARAWCRSHQRYWGVLADLAHRDASGVAQCASHASALGYVLQPRVIDVKAYASVAISLNNSGGLRVTTGGLSEDTRAVALAYDTAGGLFDAADIAQVNITPPAVRAWVAALQSEKPLGCLCCARCGHPHLDLGSFSEREHRRHYCGNCGHDGTHSKLPIISNPIFSLLALYGARLWIGAPHVHSNPVL